MELAVIDNYDSFTFNLVHALRRLGVPRISVSRNDRVDYAALERADAVLLSPGPAVPERAGDLLKLIRRFAPHKRMLGVCLGHQAIAEVFGGRLRNLAAPIHGRATEIRTLVPADPVFSALPAVFNAGRYHSWVVERNELPSELEVLAEDDAGEIMALKHRSFDCYGVQFHPESILTPLGETLLARWISR